ncbi:MAG: right-handed parallel beta-helix repeat-containing protein [Deltaproteobacteria bacterium]|nr:right-handed parallel beta-helix repeat-containing protein [Deltaproteobacteria bacterium]
MTVARSLAATAFLLALAFGPSAEAADYYVKTGGNDGLDGLSLATAWATLGQAADVVDPGDTVHVQDGDYQGFYLERSGAPGQPITFVAEGAAVRITSDNGTTPDGINLEGASHVVIDGFVVDGRTRAGIRAVLGAFVTVRNCRAGYNGRWGILTGFVDDFTAEFNETHHSVAEHGIYVSNSGDRPILRANHSHDNHANGIHMNGDAEQGGDGIIANALVERNVIHGNGVGGGSGINMDGVTDSVVRNNLLYDNHASGISLYRIDGGAASSGNLVVNNTIVTASNGRWCVNISDGSTGNRVVNNALYNLHGFRGVITIDPASRPGFTSDYNTVMSRFSLDGGDTVSSLAAWQGQGYDAHSFVATPAELFVAAGSDFHLKPGSPARDAGSAADAPPFDLDDAPRPVGAGVDIGAYEEQLVSCGDGTVDPGEQCGEAGLACADPCTTCSGCTCVPPAPVCGDAIVCGAEECEDDGQCGAAEVCAGCRCVNAPACASGITLGKASLTMRVAPASLRVQGEALIPRPWVGVDPLANGMRVVVDATSGGGGIDVTLPGGGGWTRNRSGTQWTYKDRTGAVGGITRAVLRDRSKQLPGLVRVTVQGKPAGLVLPAPTVTRTALVVGTAAECASLAWNPPTGPKPRCIGTSAKLACR